MCLACLPFIKCRYIANLYIGALFGVALLYMGLILLVHCLMHYVVYCLNLLLLSLDLVHFSHYLKCVQKHTSPRRAKDKHIYNFTKLYFCYLI